MDANTAAVLLVVVVCATVLLLARYYTRITAHLKAWGVTLKLDVHGRRRS